jgi:alkylhydroperoxidase/carboxymuconolactone decarboxylase family protein YurZ
VDRSGNPVVEAPTGTGVSHRDAAAADQEARLRGVALHDERSLASILGLTSRSQGASGLDPRGECLVRLAALHAMEGAPASYGCLVSAALAAGATAEEVVGTLVAVAPLIGVARTVAAAPELANALGYDIDAALELLDGDLG